MVHTIEEYEYARVHKKPCLVYEKHVHVEQRSRELQAFLDRIQQMTASEEPLPSVVLKRRQNWQNRCAKM